MSNSEENKKMAVLLAAKLLKSASTDQLGADNKNDFYAGLFWAGTPKVMKFEHGEYGTIIITILKRNVGAEGSYLFKVESQAVNGILIEDADIVDKLIGVIDSRFGQ